MGFEVSFPNSILLSFTVDEAREWIGTEERVEALAERMPKEIREQDDPAFKVKVVKRSLIAFNLLRAVMFECGTKYALRRPCRGYAFHRVCVFSRSGKRKTVDVRFSQKSNARNLIVNKQHCLKKLSGEIQLAVKFDYAPFGVVEFVGWTTKTRLLAFAEKTPHRAPTVARKLDRQHRGRHDSTVMMSYADLYPMTGLIAGIGKSARRVMPSGKKQTSKNLQGQLFA